MLTFIVITFWVAAHNLVLGFLYFLSFLTFEPSLMICFIFCSDLEGRHLVSHSTDLHSVASNKCFNLSLSLVSKQLCLSRPGPSHLLWWRQHPLQNGFKGPTFIFLCLLTGKRVLRSWSKRAEGHSQEVPWCFLWDWRDQPGSNQRGGVCLGWWWGKAESVITTPVEAPGRGACWPMVEKSSLSRLVPAGRDELFAEKEFQGWGSE